MQWVFSKSAGISFSIHVFDRQTLQIKIPDEFESLSHSRTLKTSLWHIIQRH